jgi:hypothetical protein
MEQQVNTSIAPFKAASSGLTMTAEKQYLATRGYRTEALLEFLTLPEHIGHWVTVDALVKLFDGRLSESGRRAMRRRVTTAYHSFMDKFSYLLLRSYNGPGQIIAVKLFDSSSTDDILFAKQQLEQQQELKAESRRVLERAAELAGVALVWDEEQPEPSADAV